jgi:spore coat protein U-like protein
MLLQGSSALAETTTAKVPVNTSLTVAGSCSVGGVIGNSPQTQTVQIGPLTWNLLGNTMTPSTPIVQTIELTCTHGQTATVTLPVAPANGFLAPSTKNGHSLPFVMWVTTSAPTLCVDPPSTEQLTQTSPSSTQPLRFYVAACANPKQTEQNSGDYTATLNATLQF